ncbi:MAG: replication initiation protein [Clostridium sp.]|uniref:replication initiation protein n=1 Tax=Clostridium sp. TaxID=1506 RepID=UPI003F3985A9
MKKEILLQPNNLVKSKYNFTPVENKLFYRILFKAQKLNDNSNGYNSVLTLDEIKDIIKFKNDTTIEKIEEMLAVYQQSILNFDYIDDNGELNTFTGGLTGPAIYNYTNKEFRINLHEVLYRHITDSMLLQKDGYTPVNLELFFEFKGAHTQRFYTLMRLWSREKKYIDTSFTLEDLRGYLKLKPEIYPEYKHFKQNVIKRALKEINAKGNMHVEIKEEIRKNRKVETIVFSIFDNEPRKYFDKKEIVKAIESKKCDNNEKNGTIESLEVKNDMKVLSELEEPLKIENKDTYVPDEDVFTKGTLRLFKKDFKEYNFKEQILNDAFEDALAITFEKDDVEIIETKSYKYFKGALENKIQEYKIEYESELESILENEQYW